MVGEFLWRGRLAIWKCSGCPLGKNSDELAGAFGVREVGARYRRRARVFGIAAESIEEPLCVNVRKPEVAKKGDSPWITPGNVDVTFCF